MAQRSYLNGHNGKKKKKTGGNNAAKLFNLFVICPVTRKF